MGSRRFSMVFFDGYKMSVSDTLIALDLGPDC
jgi:hypothetical protein